MKKILLIEDEEEMNFRLINKLKKEYDVEPAMSIDAALNVLDSGIEFDLIILDIMMYPGCYDYEKTDEGTETGWIFYQDRLKNANVKVMIWTRNRNIFDKPWGPNVVEKLIKSNEDLQLVNAVKKHIGE
jgi:CheY-like chemotaxis protein